MVHLIAKHVIEVTESDPTSEKENREQFLFVLDLMQKLINSFFLLENAEEDVHAYETMHHVQQKKQRCTLGAYVERSI
jgi:hypothetical protein